ncbi:MaoC family dehydratase [Agarilytica rhodophyticola]|uniref:MaoC family dehydratase n=1 Tax=Agarilytica rhodophyticola TaxID=1737490 RepID=UPI000B347650|nr:MaoC family dehydratase [Agarilytica rhodophyticola]
MDFFDYLKQKEREFLDQINSSNLKSKVEPQMQTLSDLISSSINKTWLSKISLFSDPAVTIGPENGILTCPKTKDFYSHWRRRIGEETYLGEWHLIDQDCIDRFADATGDKQWIHVDPVRAKTESPFKSTVAHGFLVLSLLPELCDVTRSQASLYPESKLIVNAGLNRVVFPHPVKVNSEIRARMKLKSIRPFKRSVEIVNDISIELKNSTRIACVVESVLRIYF